MFESYELMLKQAVEAMDEEALLDLMACFYKAFSNKVDADACAWSVGRNVVYRNSFKVWLVPLSETCENAFRSIGLEWCSAKEVVDVDLYKSIEEALEQIPESARRVMDTDTSRWIVNQLTEKRIYFNDDAVANEPIYVTDDHIYTVLEWDVN